MAEGPIRNLMLALMLDAWNSVATRGRSFSSEYRARETLRWVSGLTPDPRIEFTSACTYLGWDVDATREAFRRTRGRAIALQRQGKKNTYKILAT